MNPFNNNRLLGDVQKTDLDKLAKLLSSKNNGKIKYLPFLIFLRTLTSSIHEKNGKSYNDYNQLDNKKNNCKIIEQLIDNCVDKNGTLSQLRKYLIQNTKSNTSTKNKNNHNDKSNTKNSNFNDNNEDKNELCEITIPDLVKLLKHFGVLFNFQNFCQFITNIGLFPSTKNKNNVYDTEILLSNKYDDTFMSSRGIRKNAFNDFENTNNTEYSKFENKSIDGKIFMKNIFEVRCSRII